VGSQEEEEDPVPLVWEDEEEEDHPVVVVVLVEGVDFEVDLVVQMEAVVVVFEVVVEVDLLLLLASNHNHRPDWVECPDPDSIMDPDEASKTRKENKKKQTMNDLFCKYKNSYFRKSSQHREQPPPSYLCHRLGIYLYWTFGQRKY
jgi:hypothetical protein